MGSSHRGRSWTFLIAGIALLVRLAYQFEVRDLPEFNVLLLDPHIHDAIGRAIADGNLIGDEVFFRAPLYLYLVGFLYAVFGSSPWGVRLLQAVLGAATSVLSYRLGRRLFSEWVGRVAGLATALTWTLVYFDGELLITSLVTFLDLLLLDRMVAAADRPSGRRWFLAGAILGLSAIARPTILVFGWLAGIWIVWVLRDTASWPRRLRAVILYLVGSMVLIAPVTVRNVLVGNDFALIASQAGVNFYLGNNPHATGWSATSPEIGRDWWGGFDDAVWIAEEEAGRKLRPSEVSDFWTRRGLEFWGRQPADALRLSVRKLFFFWGARELGNNRDVDFYRRSSWVLRALPFSFGWLAPLALVGMIASARRKTGFLLILFVILYMATVVAFFVCARFRMPVVPALAVFAAAGASWLVGCARRRAVGIWVPTLAAVVLLTVLLRTDPYGVEDPHHTQSLFNFGLIHTRLGDDAAAERAYLETLARNPGYVDALNNLGGLYSRQGRWAEAQELFERALTVEPENPRAIYNLGAVREHLGERADAEAAYRRTLDLDSHFLPALVALGRLREAAGDLRSAGEYYGRAYEGYGRRAGLGPGDIRVRFEEEALARRLEVTVALGRITQDQGYWVPALEYYREALALDPEAEQAHYRVGFVLVRMGRHREALEELEAELDRSPDSIPARYALGLCHAALGSVVPAIREFKAVVSRDPGHERAWRNLGVLYAQSGSFDEAIDAFERALRINPNDADTQGDLDRARKYRYRPPGEP